MQKRVPYLWHAHFGVPLIHQHAVRKCAQAHWHVAHSCFVWYLEPNRANLMSFAMEHANQQMSHQDPSRHEVHEVPLGASALLV